MKNLVGFGVPEKICRMRTGHKTRAILDRYHIGNEADLERAAKLLEGQLASEPQKTDTKTGTSGFAPVAESAKSLQ